MDKTGLLQSISEYESQLEQIQIALQAADEDDKLNLLSLQKDIEQLIDLTKQSISVNGDENDGKATSSEEQQCSGESTNGGSNLDSEYSLFLSEMKKDGVIEEETDLRKELTTLEGQKCKAPHQHQWGDTVYHNALITSILMPTSDSYDNIKVKVIFINPTHKEMLLCPFLLNETGCKFSEQQCNYSHGEIVDFTSLQEYNEPKFNLLKIGGQVLAKQNDDLWYRATIKKMVTDKCMVKFHTSNKEIELPLHELYPLSDASDDEESENDNESENLQEKNAELINTTLMNPITHAFGDWEKHTKGIGSRLMEKMGYIHGMGLGKNCNGRIDPVSAVILPTGKSLDFCMNIRELAGGDKDLFSVERKLKRLQKRQEKINQKAYERAKNKTDVFNFLNNTISGGGPGASSSTSETTSSEHRQHIKMETSRSLNVARLKMEDDIKKCNMDMFKLQRLLANQKDPNSQMHKSLTSKLRNKQEELKLMESKMTNIKSEQKNRKDEKKMSVF